jgi:hypothetical protein
LKEALSKIETSYMKQMKLGSENCALAARDEVGEQLPDHIKKRMEDDKAKLKS